MSQETYLGKTVADWLEVLKSDDPLLRRLALYALGEIGEGAAPALPALAAAAQQDPAPFVRLWAAAALARVAPRRQEALTALLVGLKDEQGFVRSLAAWHLGRIGPDFPGVGEAIPRIQELVHDEDASVRTEANLALQRLQTKGCPPRELETVARDEAKGEQHREEAR